MFKTLVAVSGVFVFVQAFSLYMGGIRAGRLIHAGIIRNLLRSPLLFYEQTPSGRILNRVGKDIETIDIMIVENLRSWIGCLMKTFTIPIIIGYSTPWFLTVLLPISVLFIVIQVLT